MTEVFIMGHFSTNFNSQGVDKTISSPARTVSVYKTYCRRDRSHCQSSKTHICCDSTEAGCSLPEGMIYCTELLYFISGYLETLSCVLSLPLAGM